MKKLGTTLLLALSMLAFTAACGKKDNGNQNAGYYNCGNGQYAYNGNNCSYYPNNGQYYGAQQCQAGHVPTQMGCLPQNNCPVGYGYHPQGYNGAPGCLPVTTTMTQQYPGYQQYPGQQYPYQQYPYGGW